MPTPLSTALYIRRKNNRYRSMPNVSDARTTSATNVQITFNMDVSASNYADGWTFNIAGKVYPASGASPSGSNIVNFTLANPILKGDAIFCLYKREDGSYKGPRNEIMQSFSSNIFNMV